MGSSTPFTTLALWSTIFAPARRPAALAVVSCPLAPAEASTSGKRRAPTPTSRGLAGRCGRLGCRVHSVVLAGALVGRGFPERGRDRRRLHTISR